MSPSGQPGEAESILSCRQPAGGWCRPLRYRPQPTAQSQWRRVLVQAERYSKAVDQTPKYQGEFGAPFLYATNGEVLWFHDIREALNRSRQVSGFHTPVALNEMLTRGFDAELGRLSAIPMNEQIRPYQCEANEAIEQALRDRSERCS